MKAQLRFLAAIGIVFAALFAVMGAASVLAQSSIVYSSSYQIQNLENAQATVVLTYYNQDGTIAASGSLTVTANGSKTIFPFTSGPFGDNLTGPSTFNGSLILSSDRQIAAILNTQTTSSPFYGASTSGFSAGATSMSLPLIVCNNSGFNTWFNVQNASSTASDAHITVTYIPGANGLAGRTDPATIKPGAAKTFNQAEGSTTGTKTCADLKDASGRFVGSARITSDQPIVASVMFLGTGTIKTLQGYNGFTSGSTAINLPLIMANNSSYYTSINLQNAGVNTTTITVTFGVNKIGSPTTPNPEVFTLGPGAAKVLIQNGGISVFSPSNNWTTFGKYVSGATIAQSGAEPLVAIVNQNSTTYLSLGSAYEGFDPSAATGTVNLPLIAANNSGYYTSINLQAVSGNPAVTIDYNTNTGGGSLTEPISDTQTLTAGETWVLIQAGVPGPLTGVNNWSTAGRYVGSAKVTATGGTVIAIVNFNGPATGDTFFTYDGFGQ
jgi:hypothetical protein